MIPAHVWVAGTIALCTETGTWLSDADGRFVLRAWRDGWIERDVAFIGGRFAVQLPCGTRRQEIVGLESTLGPACLPWRDKLTVERGFVWKELNGYVVKPVVLRVLDPESGEPLDCVDVAPPGPKHDWPRTYGALHGEAIPLYHCGDEWNILAPDDWRVPWRVRAPGRVETTVPFGPGPHVVYLERAGKLSISFEGAVPATRHTFLEITCAESGFEYQKRIDPLGVPVFEGLRPAAYTVRLVHEFLDFRRVVHCERSVHLHPGLLTAERLSVVPIADDTDGPWTPNDAWLWSRPRR